MLTSTPRHRVASTSARRCFDIMCLQRIVYNISYLSKVVISFQRNVKVCASWPSNLELFQTAREFAQGCKKITVQPFTEYTLLVRMEAGLSIIWSDREHRTVVPCLAFERVAFVHIYEWNPFV